MTLWNYLIYNVCFECVLDLQVDNVVAAMSCLFLFGHSPLTNAIFHLIIQTYGPNSRQCSKGKSTVCYYRNSTARY